MAPVLIFQNRRDHVGDPRSIGGKCRTADPLKPIVVLEFEGASFTGARVARSLRGKVGGRQRAA